MAGTQPRRTLGEILGVDEARASTDQGLAEILVPFQAAQNPTITQAILDEINGHPDYKDRVRRALLCLARQCGFYVWRNAPPQWRLRPEKTKKSKEINQTWISHNNPHLTRIGLLLSILRIFNLAGEAVALSEVLSSNERVTSGVNEATRTQWSATMEEDVSTLIAGLNPPVAADTPGDDETTARSGDGDNEDEEGQYLELQKRVAGLIEGFAARSGNNKPSGRKRSREEGDDKDDSRPSQKQKFNGDIGDLVRRLLESNGARHLPVDENPQSLVSNRPAVAEPPAEGLTQPSDLAQDNADYAAYVQLCAERPLIMSEKLDSGPPHQIKENAHDHVSDVILAIAAFWTPAVWCGICTGFGDEALFFDGRTKRQAGVTSMFSGQHFIIPLFLYETDLQLSDEEGNIMEKRPTKTFSEFQQEQLIQRFSSPSKANPVEQKPEWNQKPQHILLAVAEKTGSRVRVSYYGRDTSRKYEKTIRRIARTLIRNSGWMEDRWPSFTDETWSSWSDDSANFDVRRSKVHVILTAYSWIMGFPILNVVPAMSEPFYAEGRKVINLALKGQADRRLVQAYLQSFLPITDAQGPPPNPPPNPSDAAKTAVTEGERLDAELLGEPLDEQQSSSNDDHDGSLGTPGGIPVKDQSFRSILMDKDIFKGIVEKLRAQERISRRFVPLWPTVLTHMMDMHKSRIDEKKIREQPTSIELPYDIGKLTWAIGSIWKPLLRIRPFAFGSYTLFQIFEEADRAGVFYYMAMACGQQLEKFLIPISLMGAGQLEHMGDPYALGHLVFVVASRNFEEPPDIVLELYDSFPKVIDHDTIEKAAQGIVENSGWLHQTNAPLAANVCKFSPMKDVTVPQQHGDKVCGFHAILAAWTVMLGIPIHPQKTRRAQTGEPPDRFHRTGVEIVDRALAGHMDTRTIQAFLNTYGMSVLQNLADESVWVDYVEAVKMDEEKLNVYLAEERSASLAFQLLEQDASINGPEQHHSNQAGTNQNEPGGAALVEDQSDEDNTDQNGSEQDQSDAENVSLTESQQALKEFLDAENSPSDEEEEEGEEEGEEEEEEEEEEEDGTNQDELEGAALEANQSDEDNASQNGPQQDQSDEEGASHFGTGEAVLAEDHAHGDYTSEEGEGEAEADSSEESEAD